MIRSEAANSELVQDTQESRHRNYVSSSRKEDGEGLQSLIVTTDN